MALKNTSDAWGWVARAFHWVMALMILILLGVGFYMTEIEQDLIRQFQLTQTHKSFGFVVFILAILRVVWKFRAGPTPSLPSHMPRWQKSASHISHIMLYILMFWMPLSGWLMASASPLNNEGAYPARIANKVFGLFELPDPFLNGTKELTEIFANAHWFGAVGIVLILAIHVGAALKHHFLEHDTILMRMIKG